MDKEEMLAYLGGKLGTRLSFDEGNNCCLLLQDQYSVNFWYDDTRDAVVATGVVATEMPDEEGDITYADLLDLSLVAAMDGDPAIGREPESGMLVAYCVFNLKNMTEADLGELFVKYVEFQVLMTEYFNQLEEA